VYIGEDVDLTVTGEIDPFPTDRTQCTLSASVYDARLGSGSCSKSVTATISVSGKKIASTTGTLSGSGYAATANLDFHVLTSRLGKTANITITDGTNTWTTTQTLAAATSVSIGQKLYPVTLSFVQADMPDSITGVNVTVTGSGYSQSTQNYAGGTTITSSRYPAGASGGGKQCGGVLHP
jgi:hypothetical protein